MLDVHAPEGGIHGTRDFLIHLLTITVGLLIALGLENAAEAMHHRHQRKEAEASIREELRKNRDDLLQGAPILTGEIKDMRQVVAFVQGRSEGQQNTPPKVKLEFHEGPIPNSAWETASNTGALSYMEYTEVQHFADAYKEQALLQTTEEKALEDYFEMDSFLMQGKDPALLSKEDAIAVLPYTRQAEAHLEAMLAVGEGTVGSMNDALK